MTHPASGRRTGSGGPPVGEAPSGSKRLRCCLRPRLPPVKNIMRRGGPCQGFPLAGFDATSEIKESACVEMTVVLPE